jgi:site-specific recombinase XerC
MTPPRMCAGCQSARVAWDRPRVDYCYQCLPGGPFKPPPCIRCGSEEEYFSQGLCGHCHAGAPGYLFSCKDCLAWGVLRAHNRRCWGCRYWRGHFPVAECPYCRRELPVGEAGACRLCWRQAHHMRSPGEPLDLAAANRYGQQLFFANMEQSHLPRAVKRTKSVAGKPNTSRAHSDPTKFRPVGYRQDPLFYVPRGTRELAAKAAGRVPDPAMGHHLERALRDHAAAHGWSVKQTNSVGAALRAVQACQDVPGSRVLASEVVALGSIGHTIESTLEVLAVAGLLDDDRVPALRRYFERQTAGLPAPMLRQLEVWYDVMTNGSTTAPRRKPRHPNTVRFHTRDMNAALRSWVKIGVTDLSAIDTVHVDAVLPESGSVRAREGQALRSLFTILKQRKMIFYNPMSRIQVGGTGTTIPQPLDTAAIRAALNHPRPSVALAVALVAFCGLTSAQVCHIKLTDISDGYLSIDDRRIRLAGPVKVRLAAWLDYRAQTWPNTLNPYLLVSRKSAPRTKTVSRKNMWNGVEFNAQALREDRILNELLESGGDIRRVYELFGLTVSGAMRYTAALNHPDLDDDTPSSRTHDLT